MKQSLVLTALLAATPLALLLPGCSGGAAGLIPLFPTPTPRPTATPVPATSQTSNFTLGNGQRAILITTANGNRLTGTMQILAPLANTRSAAALSSSFRIGTYIVNGPLTPPRGYNFTVFEGTTPLFTFSGQLSTTTQTGTYLLTTPDGQTDSGTIPVIQPTTPNATATPRPTTAPGFVDNLTFTPSEGSDFVKYPLLQGSFSIVRGGNEIGGGVTSRPVRGLVLQFLTINTTVGSTLTYQPDRGRDANFLSNVQTTTSSEGKVFYPESGTITLTALDVSGNSATVRFDEVVYAASPTNKVTVSGSYTGPLSGFRG